MKRKQTRQNWSAISWRRIVAYAALLAVGVLVLQWIEYQQFARTHSGELRLTLLAALFLGIGIWAGAQLFRSPPPPGAQDDGNPAARQSLGISEREFEVLQHLAAGHSNKEIARLLGVSPNTIKTHVARLLEKLDASRRTEAIRRARELGIVR